MVSHVYHLVEKDNEDEDKPCVKLRSYTLSEICIYENYNELVLSTIIFINYELELRVENYNILCFDMIANQLKLYISNRR